MSVISVGSDGTVTVDGLDIPYQRIELVKEVDELWRLKVTLPVPAWDGIGDMPATVSYVVRLLGTVESVDAEGPTVPAALRALAERLEAVIVEPEG